MQLLRHYELWKLLFDEQDDSVAFMMPNAHMKLNTSALSQASGRQWMVRRCDRTERKVSVVTLWTFVRVLSARLAHSLPFFFHFRLLPSVLCSSFALKSVKIKKKEALDTVELLSRSGVTVEVKGAATRQGF